jgi:thiol-disulfide isomerase/thioredoxin
MDRDLASFLDHGCYAARMILGRSGWQILLVTLGLLVSCGGSCWVAAVDDAKTSKKVLSVEFYADWCGPCKHFEANVLSDNEVKGALKNVEFRRFDYDSAAGKKYAHRMGVRAIPAVVAVGRDGKGFRALKGSVPKSMFLRFLVWSQEQVYPPAG